MSLLVLTLIIAALVLLVVLVRILTAISPSAQAEEKILAGQGYEQMGRMEEALHQYRTSLELDPQNITGQQSVCRLLLKKEKFAEAIACFENLISTRTQSDATGLQILIDCVRCLQRNQKDRAMNQLEELASGESGSFESSCAELLLSSFKS